MADIATDIASWSGTAGSNSPSGGTNIGAGLDDNLRAMQAAIVLALNSKGTDIASATPSLAATDGLFHDVTGTTAITSFGTVRAGIWKVLKFEGALTLTHHATSMILLGGANRTTAVGDIGMYVSEGSGNWREVFYSAVGGTAFTDSNAIVVGSSDSTKKARFEVDGLSTGTTRVYTLQDSDDTLVGRATTDTLTNKTITDSTNTVAAGVLGTPQASTSGNAIQFTGIPSWAKSVTMMIVGMSSNGTASFLVQAGPSGGVETSGYVTTTSTQASDTTSTTGALISSASAANVWHGYVEFIRENTSTNTWVVRGGVTTSAGTNEWISGSKAFAGVLERIRVVTTDTLDAGEINIKYQ